MKITDLSIISFRVTGTVPLPVPLPLNDIVPILLTVEMNENVSPGKGWGSRTDMIPGKEERNLQLCKCPAARTD